MTFDRIEDGIDNLKSAIYDHVRRKDNETDAVIGQRNVIIRILEKRGLWAEIKAELEAELKKPPLHGVMTGISE